MLYFANLGVYSLHSMMRIIVIILLSLNLYSNSNVPLFLIDQNTILPASKVFNIETSINDDAVIISWEIEEGYYLYE